MLIFTHLTIGIVFGSPLSLEDDRHDIDMYLDLLGSALPTVAPSINFDDFNMQTDLENTAPSFPTALIRKRRNHSPQYLQNLKSRFKSQDQLRKLLRSIRGQVTPKKSRHQLRHEVRYYL